MVLVCLHTHFLTPTSLTFAPIASSLKLGPLRSSHPWSLTCPSPLVPRMPLTLGPLHAPHPCPKSEFPHPCIPLPHPKCEMEGFHLLKPVPWYVKTFHYIFFSFSLTTCLRPSPLMSTYTPHLRPTPTPLPMPLICLCPCVQHAPTCPPFAPTFHTCATHTPALCPAFHTHTPAHISTHIPHVCTRPPFAPCFQHARAHAPAHPRFELTHLLCLLFFFTIFSTLIILVLE
jgi:hypothetical protein